jgi:hypothetical protein
MVLPCAMVPVNLSIIVVAAAAGVISPHDSSATLRICRFIFGRSLLSLG